MTTRTKKRASSVPEETPKLSPKDVWEESEWKRIAGFIRATMDKETPYPIPGLTLNFLPDNGRIRMVLDVKEASSFRPSFIQACVNNRTVLDRWRQRLTAFENRSRWEFLPHPAQILIARSKKGQACLEWMKSSDPALWETCVTGRGTGLSPGQLSKELNQTIESWLRDYCKGFQEGNHVPLGRVMDTIGVLTVVGFEETEARLHCDDLIGDILNASLDLNPFHNGRAKYCRPVTQRMIENRLKSWISD